MVSYWRSPGGHWGPSLSSTAVMPVPDGEVGSSSDPNPPSKNVPEKSSAWALTVFAEEVAAAGFRRGPVFGLERKDPGLWDNESSGDDGNLERNSEQAGEFTGGEGCLSVEVSEDDAMVEEE